MFAKSVILLGVMFLASTLTPVGFNVGRFEFGGFRDATASEERLSFDDSVQGMYRQVIAVPAFYGKVIQIVPGTNNQTLWFESDDGQLRNVLVMGQNMVLIKREGTRAKD